MQENRPFASLFSMDVPCIRADGAHEMCRPPKQFLHLPSPDPSQGTKQSVPMASYGLSMKQENRPFASLASLQTVHTKCAVHPNSFSVLRSPFPVPRDPSPGRSVTRARRIYVSSLANFRSSDRPQIRGSAQGCALPPTAPRMAHLAGTPLPIAGSLNG